jgi:acetylornithine/succinyldiaminopimelate/putrescine aminotransferase
LEALCSKEYVEDAARLPYLQAYFRKQAPALAHERGKLYQATLDAIKGVAFLGTPHDGSNLATTLGLLAKIAKVASLGHTNSKLVSALKSQGDELLSISESFVERGEKLDKIYSFF